MLYQLSYTPKIKDVTVPSCREMAPDRRSPRRGAVVIADRNVLSSLAAPDPAPSSRSLNPIPVRGDSRLQGSVVIAKIQATE